MLCYVYMLYKLNVNLSESTEISCHYETFITARAILWRMKFEMNKWEFFN